MKIYIVLAGALSAGALANGAHAQEAAPNAASSAPAPAATIKLPMNTPVQFEFVTELSSKTNKNDDVFPIRLIAPVQIAGHDAIPAGTMGQGQVVQAAKAGFAGKAGELVVTVRYLDVGGVHVPLRRFRMGELATGEDRRGEAFGMSIAISPLLGFFISGGQKTIVVGTHANAIVSADTDIPALPAPAPAAEQVSTTK